ncbi:hypothetical protein LZ32DRAFT_536560 [Colletotrichum eremochloae]|nr:hypothetical protein LZ32DRAFT_536560 [Colletotrichum eremochloae]
MSEPRVAADNHDGGDEVSDIGDDVDTTNLSELSDRGTSVAFSLASRPVTPSFENESRELGLSAPGWFSDFTDYDVITVHGLRDNHSTMWKSKSGDSWLQERLFGGRFVRQLDFVYAIDDSARVFQPDGIEAESQNLLRLYAENRRGLPDALIEASQAVYPSDFDDLETWEHMREARGQIARLSTTIIFLGCPHKTDSIDVLEDELHTLMSLPGPDIESGLIRKIKNVALQVEDTNTRFLETKLLSRLVHISVFNLTSLLDLKAAKEKKPTGGTARGTDKSDANENGMREEDIAASSEKKPAFAAADISQTDHDGLAATKIDRHQDAESSSALVVTKEDTRHQGEITRPAFTELPVIRGSPFSRYTSCMYSTFEVHSRYRQAVIDHAALVRGDDDVHEGDSWVTEFRTRFEADYYSMLAF